MNPKHDPVDIYAASRYGQHLAANQGDEVMREYAATSFAGVFASPGDFAKVLWAGMSDSERTDYVESCELPPSPASMPHADTIGSLVDGMIHSNIVEFVQVEDDGIYVYDETRF